MGEVISVFEYDLLGSGKAASVGAKPVPPQVFNYLEALSLASNQGSQFLKLTSRSGFKLLQVQNYAVNRPGFPGECFICELRLPDHRFRWKHNKLFLLLPE